MRLIVTGFEPFGGAEVNASWEAVRRLEGVEKVLLPVSFTRAEGMIRELVAGAPDAVICVGEAGGRSSISVERVAVNLMDARIPDNDGARPVDGRIAPDGPAAYFATLPTRRIATRLREANIPAELSYTAGTYVVRPAWATTWRWKSATRLAVGSVSRRQGCPSRGGIRRKPDVGGRI